MPWILACIVFHHAHGWLARFIQFRGLNLAKTRQNLWCIENRTARTSSSLDFPRFRYVTVRRYSRQTRHNPIFAGAPDSWTSPPAILFAYHRGTSDTNDMPTFSSRPLLLFTTDMRLPAVGPVKLTQWIELMNPNCDNTAPGFHFTLVTIWISSGSNSPKNEIIVIQKTIFDIKTKKRILWYKYTKELWGYIAHNEKRIEEIILCTYL